MWLGLLSSVVITVVCLSGSIYAFKSQIENLINSDLVYNNSQHKQSFNIDVIALNFEKKYGKPTLILIPENLNKNIFISSRSKNILGTEVYYHRYTGEFLGIKSRTTTSFFEFILDIHRFLLMDELGKTINGISILIFVFLLFSGFILWLPKKLKSFKKNLVIKWDARFYRINYDLHRILGLYSLIILFFIAITGLYVSFHWVKNTIIVGLGGDSIIISENNIALQKSLSDSFNKVLNDLSREENTASLKRVSLTTIINKTDSVFNYEGNMIIKLPTSEIKKTVITKMNTDNLIGFNFPDIVEYSLNGKINNLYLFKKLKLHQQFKAIAKPLHTGEILGLPSIILYFVISLIGTSLPITGFIIWWKKIKNKKLLYVTKFR